MAETKGKNSLKTTKSKKSPAPAKSGSGTKTAAKRGRPPGTKTADKRGRPPGTKNASKTRMTAAERAAAEKERMENYKRNRMISAVVMAALGVFMMISIYTRLAGALGRGICFAVMGLFGFAGFFLPFFFIVFGILIFAERREDTGRMKTVLLLLGIFIMFAATISIESAGNDAAFSFGTDWLKACFNNGEAGQGGGLVGMLTAYLMVKVIGRGGAYLFAALCLIVLLIFTLYKPVKHLCERYREKREAGAEAKYAAVLNSVEEEQEEYCERGEQDLIQLQMDLERLRELEALPVSGRKKFNPGKKFNLLRYFQQDDKNMFEKNREEDAVGTDGENHNSHGLGGEDGLYYKDSNTPDCSGADGQTSDKNTDTDVTEVPLDEIYKANDIFGKKKADEAGVQALADDMKLAPSPFKPDKTKNNAAFFQNIGDRKERDTREEILEKSDSLPQERDNSDSSFAEMTSEGSFEDILEKNDENESCADAEINEENNNNEETDDSRTSSAINTAKTDSARNNAGKVLMGKAVISQINRDGSGDNRNEDNVKDGNDEKDPDSKASPVISDDNYELPELFLLKDNGDVTVRGNDRELRQKAELLEKTLKSFNVAATVKDVSMGPTVTRFEVQPAAGVKVSRIKNLHNDIALNLEAKSIRIEAPIPGKAAVGIEIENDTKSPVYIREVIQSPEFKNSTSKISFSVGRDISGNPVVANLKEMPHLLIAGSTGSGKSVCVNNIILSILYKAKPSEVKFILIDPKMVELSNYNGIPHLLIPVVTEPSKAAAALSWAVKEMDDRYRKFQEHGVRELAGYNKKLASEPGFIPMPQIVIIIDELADLMATSPQQVEDAICRLAQKARAAGMHLIVATQRPSVDVITGVIKANIPSRIAFAVSSAIDSRTILDTGGAENLVGKGDMLFNPIGQSKPLRVQGAFVSDDEIEAVISFVSNQGHEQIFSNELMNTLSSSKQSYSEEEVDEFMRDAVEYVVIQKQASVSMLQRKFRIGYNRAARIVDAMEERGIVGPADGARPRQVFLKVEDLDYIDECGNFIPREDEFDDLNSCAEEYSDISDSDNGNSGYYSDDQGTVYEPDPEPEEI